MKTIITFNHNAETAFESIIIDGTPLPKEAPAHATITAALIMTEWTTDDTKRNVVDLINTAATHASPTKNPIALILTGWAFANEHEEIQKRFTGLILTQGLILSLQDENLKLSSILEVISTDSAANVEVEPEHKDTAKLIFWGMAHFVTMKMRENGLT